ncbi:MAG: AAA family ATPase [Anaerolineae bacterium]|jgi:hypothetical protein|nr:AAA family ATPase [Anaerolineae bacterium]MBT7075089.1 AAA family ATPase [Anaerolineae bacterium]MBT7782833.1 AAA family ATPase [Anaerolineae bacterium]
MKFSVNKSLLSDAHFSLRKRKKLYWIIGGAGSGKTTICKALSENFGFPIYDMDAHIYGDYHSRFTQELQPVNKAWANTENGLAWLLDMSWDEFNNFNQAALPEYLNLLAEDLDDTNENAAIIIDGGISNPALLSQVIPPHQIISLARPERSSAEIWSENEERKSMKEFVFQLPNPEKSWHNFLEFDARITSTILREAQKSNITIFSRSERKTVNEFAKEIMKILEYLE